MSAKSRPFLFPERTAALGRVALGCVPAIAALWATFGSTALAASPSYGGTIQYGHEQEPTCLYGPWIQEWYLERQFADNLVSRTGDGKFVPWLATHWTISSDHKTYIFQIKPGVKFTDGTPLNAQAIAYNFNLWLSKDPE